MEDAEFIEIVNSAEVSEEELVSFTEVVENFSKHNADSCRDMDLLANRYRTEPNKLAALWGRWHATVRFVRTKTAKAWTLPPQEAGGWFH
jgi:hypothetical protein